MIEYSRPECDYAEFNGIKKDRDESPYLLKKIKPNLDKSQSKIRHYSAMHLLNKILYRKLQLHFSILL